MMIKINDDREFEIKTLYSGYLEENNTTTLEFEFPEYLEKYNKKANFELKDGTKVCKLFDDITSNKLTLTRDLLKFNKLQMAIEFFDTEENLIYRTSILTIIISDSIICDDDVSPEDSKVVILNDLIQKVTEFNSNATEKTTAYNDNAEDKLSEYNTNATNKISEYNSNAEAILKLLPCRTTEIQEVIDIDDSAESSFNQLKVFGNSQQKSTTGAAKVDFRAFAGDYSDEQMEIKIDENGIISLKGTVSAYYSKKIGTLTKDMFVAGNNAYYARSNNSNNSSIFMQSIGSISFSSINNSPSFEITDESQESDLYIVVNYLESGTLNVNEILYPMISLESNTLYEPYTGGNPSPSPNYPQKINSVGRKSKNILDISNLYTESNINGVTVKYNNDGTLTLKGTSTASIDLYLREGVPLEHGNYSYKCFGLPENIYTNIYYAGDVYGETVKNFTVSNDNNYGIVIKIPINTTIDTVIKPMLVKGVYYDITFPEFEPFYNSKIVKFKRLRKDLLDMSNARGGTSNGITVEIKQDGSYSYVGTATDNAISNAVAEIFKICVEYF